MSFITLLLEWYQTHKRDLPWRLEKSVYRIWLSEIILQQTRVKQGLSYYQNFVERYPDVNALASASEQSVLKLWQGLGYYSRARNLHKTAQIVAKEHNGVFPKNYSELKKLPGIGPYTAAAIASICFDERVPAIDGNAYRVYARLYVLDKDISDSNAHKYFFEFVQDKMPLHSSGEFNEAIMELGATVCLPKNPLCMKCPIDLSCLAYQTGTIDKYPVKTKKVKVKKRYFHYYFIHNENEEFLIKNRTKKDVWLNLNDFPLWESKNATLKDNPFPNDNTTLVADYKHVLTHQRIFIKIYTMRVDTERLKVLSKNLNSEMIHASMIKDIPFPKPIFSFLHEQYPEYI